MSQTAMGPINYAADPVWGSDYQRALSRGDQAMLDRYKSQIEARQTGPGGTNVSQQAAMIMAKTLDQGRGSTNVWANGNDGLEYNTVGQSRTPGVGAMNFMDGGYKYDINPGPAMGAPVGSALDATPTMTQAQYGASQTPAYGASPTGSAGNSFDQNTINRFYRQGASGTETTKPLQTGGPGPMSGGLTQWLQQMLQQMQGDFGGNRGINPPGVFDWNSRAGMPTSTWGNVPQPGYRTDPSWYIPEHGVEPHSGWDPNMAYAGGSPYFDETHGRTGYTPSWSQPGQWSSMNQQQWGDQTHGMQGYPQMGSYGSPAPYRAPQTNWGGGYGSRQGHFYQGPLSQMFQNGWGR